MKSQISVLKTYFGIKPDQKATDFMKEVNRLSDGEKLSLAQLAARELKLKQNEVNFTL